jgi:excisionase family DNA binding protein
MDLLRLHEMAKTLRMSPHTLRQWVHEGKVPFVRIGRIILFEKNKLEDFVRENTTESTSKNMVNKFGREQ